MEYLNRIVCSGNCSYPIKDARFTIAKELCSIPFFDLLETKESALVIRIHRTTDLGVVSQ